MDSLVGAAVELWVVNVRNGADDYSTDGPEELKNLSSRGSKSHRHDLTAVGRGVGDEDSPGDTFEKLGCEEDGQRVGEEHDKDESVESHESTDCRPPVSDPTSQRTSEEHSDEGTEGTTHLESGLPTCLDNLSSTTVRDTECVTEGWQGDIIT